eukprot:GHVQ01014797.1.p1 GENE.GHVQ01014797.1~~GHVQ01014797.1.p1  ORF type:complete len:822 (+),score=139.79 GHVQ01014797.1:171-2636(+)
MLGVQVVCCLVLSLYIIPSINIYSYHYIIPCFIVSWLSSSLHHPSLHAHSTLSSSSTILSAIRLPPHLLSHPIPPVLFVSAAAGGGGGEGADGIIAFESEQSEALKLNELIGAMNIAVMGNTNGLVIDTASHGHFGSSAVGGGISGGEWEDGRDFFPVDIPVSRMKTALSRIANAASDRSCDESNTVYSPGTAIAAMWHGVQSPAVCNALCKLVGDMCRYWTYVWNRLFPESFGGSCFLKSHQRPVVPTWQDSYRTADIFQIISGPRDCPVVALLPEPITSVEGCPSSPELCDSLNQLPGGVGAIFDQRCGEKAIDNNNCSAAVGHKCCTYCGQDEGYGHKCSSDCYRRGIDYEGGNVLMYTWHSIPSPAHCHTLCLTFVDCTHFLYFKHIDNSPNLLYHSSLLPSSPPTSPSARYIYGGGCVVKEYSQAEIGLMNTSDKLTVVSPQTHKVEAVFGPRTCPPPDSVPEEEYVLSDDVVELESTTTTSTTTTSPDGCFLQDTDFYGFDIALRSTDSAPKCKHQCQLNPLCSFFTFMPNTVSPNRNCFLKARNADSDKRTVPSHISGPRCCMADDSCSDRSNIDPCMEIGVDYFGYDIKSLAGEESAEACQRACLIESSCLFWSFAPHSNVESICWLKFSADAANRGVSGWVAGRRVCEGDDFAGLTSNMCYTPNILYDSISGQDTNVLVTTSSLPGSGDPDTPHACAVKCAAWSEAETNCAGWSFTFSSRNVCSLLSRIDGMKYARGAVSAPRDCPYKVPSSEKGVTYNLQEVEKFKSLTASRRVDMRNAKLWKAIEIGFKMEEDGSLCSVTDRTEKATSQR